jgi:hypothetical protein
MSNGDVALTLDLASRHGIVRAIDLRAKGVTRRVVDGLVETRVVDRCGPGLLMVRAAPITFEQRALVAALLGGGDGRVSHRAAAKVLGISERSAPVEIIGRRSTAHPRSVVIHRRGDLEPGDVGVWDGIPVTSATRTIIDLGAVADPSVVECALDRALQRGLTTLDDVSARLASMSRRGRRGIGTISSLLERRDVVRGVTETDFETRLLGILQARGLPDPVRQHVLRDAEGRFVARFDAAYPGVLVGFEADSEAWHMDRQRFIADRTRRNRAEALGWRVPCFTWHHLTRDPEHVAGTVERTLVAAGWDGSFDPTLPPPCRSSPSPAP